MSPKKRISGSSDPITRFEIAGQSLGEARRRNRDLNWPVIVEGKRDKIALVNLGFTGPIELLNRGWTIERVVTYVFENYGTRNRIDGGSCVSILMDWDRTGGRLQRKLVNLMEGLDMFICQDTRNVLMKALKPETRVLEGLNGLSEYLLPSIEKEDLR